MNNAVNMSEGNAPELYGYDIDLVLCLDATGDRAVVVDEFRRNIKRLYELVQTGIDDMGKALGNLRVKIIAFRDFAFFTTPPIEESVFFELPRDNEDIEAFLSGIQCRGGGDIAENSLEALALAIKADFAQPRGRGSRVRHIVALLTDAPALDLSARRDCMGYPEGMPKDLDELADWWNNGIEGYPYIPRSGRMLAVAPYVEPWNKLDAALDRAYIIQGDRDCRIDFDDFVNLTVAVATTSPIIDD